MKKAYMQKVYEHNGVLYCMNHIEEYYDEEGDLIHEYYTIYKSEMGDHGEWLDWETMSTHASKKYASLVFERLIGVRQ